MIYRFADCLLDPARHELKRAGEPVHVEPQVFTLLQEVVAAGGRMVSYDQLVESVWRGRIVSESTIAARIGAAR